MRLAYHLPRADLRDYVRVYYLFESDGPVAQPMSAELGNVRCLIAGTGRFVMRNGAVAPFSPITLVGPTMGAYRMEAGAGLRAFGVGVLPRGWRALLGVSAAELADMVIDFSAVAGPSALAAAEEIRNASGLPEMAAAADRYFAYMLDRFGARLSRPYPDAFESWLTDGDDLDIDALAGMMDVSRRQIDRIAKQYFGASPKVLQRKYRALRAADRILFGGARTWLDAAGPSFYDQSHFIKEFKAFVGATPKAFADRHAELASTILAKRRVQVPSVRAAAL
ncbi:AraC family transcriptional regulator [Amphiplicatus metriothermophilus]|uniref:Transcriptional regulator, AraC family n=1 Tax=Amphiplicatus metriothermophilus TaxID=1519374 RepID=A0A239PLU8_9PROT|nr:helix-turn-helix domain-containing protein [Amphiplicatus metriothermophilus]MBB5517592.1 AraC-like DNA-binding protein [Amphiplicatus metriothermophilus]SNT68074.1 transcriptional regulator, AraC family [Amphiplicatus metriothermophilus]